MANFIGPITTKEGNQVFLNLDHVTDFLYDKNQDVTVVYILAEQGFREYPGDLTEMFFQTWRRCYE